MSNDDMQELKQRSAALESRVEKLRSDVKSNPPHEPEPPKWTVAGQFRDLLELVGYWMDLA